MGVEVDDGDLTEGRGQATQHRQGDRAVAAEQQRHAAAGDDLRHRCGEGGRRAGRVRGRGVDVAAVADVEFPQWVAVAVDPRLEQVGRGGADRRRADVRAEALAVIAVVERGAEDGDAAGRLGGGRDPHEGAHLRAPICGDPCPRTLPVRGAELRGVGDLAADLLGEGDDGHHRVDAEGGGEERGVGDVEAGGAVEGAVGGAGALAGIGGDPRGAHRVEALEAQVGGLEPRRLEARRGRRGGGP